MRPERKWSLTVCVTRLKILDPNECSAAVGLVWRSLRAPKLKQPMAAFDINSHSVALGFEKLGSHMCLRLAFSPVLYAIGYTYVLRIYGLYVPKWVAKGKWRKVQEFSRKRSDWLVPKRSQRRNRKCTTLSSRTQSLSLTLTVILTMAPTINLQ